MGDIKKAAGWVVPIVLAFATGGGSLLATGFLTSLSALEGAMLGNALVGLIGGKKKSNGAAAPVYGLGNPSNTQSPFLSIPIIYGQMRVPGNVVYNLQDGAQIYKWPVVFCQGEVDSIEKVFINNYGIDEWTGCSSDEYTGTLAQTNDARFSDYLGSLKKKAYSACTVQASAELQGNATITGLVKGKKVPVYNGSTWTTEWSDNFIWVMRDALITLGGMAEADMGDDATWYAEAQHCDEVVTDEYDIGDNLMLAGTITGGTNPTTANNGNLRPTAADNWYIIAPQSETMVELGQGDLGSVELCKLIRLHLWDGDGREFYNYKITYSEDDITYTTLVDRTGSGKNYIGRQSILLDTPISARYFKVYSSGSTDGAFAGVKEFEVFEAVPAKRYRASAYVRDSGSAASIIDQISLAAPARVVENKGKVYIKIDRALGAGDVAATFDESNIVADSLTISEIPRREVANFVDLKFIDPWNDWNLRSVYSSDVIGQEDNGVIKKDITIESITNEPQALRMVQMSLNLANVVRFYVSFEAGLNSVQITPGDIIDHDFDAGHWATGISQYLRVVSVSENPETGTRRLHCIEHFEALYDDTAATSSNTSYNRVPYVDPLKQAPGQITGLALAEGETQPGDGTWIPTIEVTWTNPTDPWFDHSIVELSDDGGSTYDEVGQTAGEYFLINNLVAGQEYYVRVRSVSKYGISGSTSIAPSDDITLVGKDVAPGNISGFDYTLKVRSIELVWATAVDANNDLSYYEIRDGASWAAGVVLFTDLKTNRISYKPTKRTYKLWIKAFDRSGNESAAATELDISVTAPQVSTAITLTQMPPTNIMVEFAAITGNPFIIRYDIHASTSSSFTPDATTLLTQAVGSVTGKILKDFKGVVDDTYYVKVCAIDYLSDVVGDQYDYPSGEYSKIVRLIDGDDIVANSILTYHLSTSGIDVGGDGSKPIYIRVFDAAGNVVGYVGEYEWDSDDVYGGLFENLIVGDPLDPAMEVLDDGTARINRSLNIGGDVDKIISTGENVTNILPNGGFEQTIALGAMTAAAGVPAWIAVRTGSGSYYVREKSSYDFDVYGPSGQKCLQVYTDTTNKWTFRSDFLGVGAAEKLQASIYARANTASPAIPMQIIIYEYDRSQSTITNTTIINESLTNTTPERFTGNITLNASTAYVKVYFVINNTAATSNYAFVDCFQVESGEAVTQYREPQFSSTDLPTGMALSAETGMDVYSSGALRSRVGDISGLDDGAGGSVPASTNGIWNKGGFYFLDAAGDAMITASGIEDDAYISDTIATAIIKSATTDQIAGVVASGTISKTSSFPATVTFSYSSSVVPILWYRWRGYDSGTSAYSAWCVGGGPMYYTSSEVVYTSSCFAGIEYRSGVPDIRIVFFPRANTGSATYTFSSSFKTNFFLYNSGYSAVQNIWDEIEIQYMVTVEGGLV